MVHGVEQLVFVDEASNDEVDQTEEEDQPRALKHAVHGADDENQECLWKVEAVTEDGWLNKLCVVWPNVSTTANQCCGSTAYPVVSWPRSAKWDTARHSRTPTNERETSPKPEG